MSEEILGLLHLNCELTASQKNSLPCGVSLITGSSPGFPPTPDSHVEESKCPSLPQVVFGVLSEGVQLVRSFFLES